LQCSLLIENVKWREVCLHEKKGEKNKKAISQNEHRADFNFRRATQNCVSLASKWGGLARHGPAKGKYRCFTTAVATG
jgi:hypothetical protein